MRTALHRRERGLDLLVAWRNYILQKAPLPLRAHTAVALIPAASRMISLPSIMPSSVVAFSASVAVSTRVCGFSQTVCVASSWCPPHKPASCAARRRIQPSEHIFMCDASPPSCTTVSDPVSSASTETSSLTPPSAAVTPLCPSLYHRMQFKEVRGLRRWLRGPRMAVRLRGRLRRGTILTARIGGALSEEDPPDRLFAPAPTYTSLALLTRALRLAAHDPRIAHLYVRVDLLGCGWGKILEARRHLDYFSQSGKGITVFMEAGAEKEFFLTCGLPGCDVYVVPEGALSLRGFMASGTFVRGVLEKVGVEPQVERIGEFKSAGDQLGRKDMSPAQRLVLESLLDQMQTMFVKSVARTKGMLEQDVLDTLDKGLQCMQDFVDAKLISGLRYENQIEDELKLRFKRRSENEKEQNVLRRKLDMVKIFDYGKRTTEKMLGLRGKQKIALIRAVGAIASGKNGQSPLFGATIGSETMLELLRKAELDKSVKAVILRVDSPGGSALASDVIWHAVGKLASKKPVVASMVDVAASGGYYVSMGVPIVAEAATLTGSIGVVTAKPALHELYKRIGYTKETISKGRYAELEVDSRAFTEDEAAYFRRGAERAYRSFVGKAADSRGVPFETMDAVAQGRVWTGLQASEKGLVDHIGGLWRAVEIAKEKAELDDEYVRVEEITPQLSPFQALGFGDACAQNEYSSIAKLITSGEPLALCELDATLGSGQGMLAGLGPLQKAVVVAVVESISQTSCTHIFKNVVKTISRLP